MYTEEFYRGLPTKDCISESYVTTAAFQFDTPREDGYQELSINWNDDEGALAEIFSKRKKDGNIQFKLGAAVLNLKNMTSILKDHIATKRFLYERHEVDGNIYHGNLLLKSDTPKQLKTLITAGLCLAASNNILSNPNSSDT